MVEFVSNGFGEYESELQSFLERLEAIAPFMSWNEHNAKETLQTGSFESPLKTGRNSLKGLC